MAEIFRLEGPSDRARLRGSSCAFGVFDGVHVGHRFLLECARWAAREKEGKSVALTFDIDPDELFHPQRLKKLMDNDERVDMLARSGVDAVAVLPFTPQLAARPPACFLHETFDEGVPYSLHVGSGFKFGAHVAGSVRDLEAWGAASGARVQVHELKSEDGRPITATRIRLLLGEGDVEEANRLLGRPYFITGVVEPGRGEGAALGFRTANLRVCDQMRTLGDGVYAAWAQVGGSRYRAAVNVGVAASFADRACATCEVHLLDFEGNLYGSSVRVEFMHWLRPMKKFTDLQELKAAVQDNISWVRERL